MPENSTVIDKTADALGIDSLIAVEMRSWLLKELGVDLPLLVIIGGKTMRQVLEACRARIDPAMAPLLQASERVNADSEVRNGEGYLEARTSAGRHGPVTTAHVQPSTVPSVQGVVTAGNEDAGVTETDADVPSAHTLARIPDGQVVPTDAKSVPSSNRMPSEQGSSDVQRLHGGDELHQNVSDASSGSCNDDDKSGQVIDMKGGAVGVYTVSDESPSSLSDVKNTKTSRRLFGRLLRSRRFASWRRYL